jgi:hypothetical protein
MIECDVPDNGSLAISKRLVSALVALGVAGYPTIQVARQMTDSASASVGRIELLVFSGTERPVTVPGLVSCMTDEDCPDGRTCNASDKTCQSK